MQRYSSTNKNTGVIAFELLPDGIAIKFRDGPVYLYTAESAGRDHIIRMKALAAKGEGLTTYINQHVRGNYKSRLN